jgi:hypothetical protein
MCDLQAAVARRPPYVGCQSCYETQDPEHSQGLAGCPLAGSPAAMWSPTAPPEYLNELQDGRFLGRPGRFHLAASLAASLAA